MMHLLRRDFVAGLLSGVVAAGCRSKDEAGAKDDAIGPLLAPAALAARIEEVKAGKIAVLYVGPDMLFGRGHVPGARKLGALELGRPSARVLDLPTTFATDWTAKGYPVERS